LSSSTRCQPRRNAVAFSCSGRAANYIIYWTQPANQRENVANGQRYFHHGHARIYRLALLDRSMRFRASIACRRENHARPVAEVRARDDVPVASASRSILGKFVRRALVFGWQGNPALWYWSIGGCSLRRLRCSIKRLPVSPGTTPRPAGNAGWSPGRLTTRCCAPASLRLEPL
jgi:hypothetical protein